MWGVRIIYTRGDSPWSSAYLEMINGTIMGKMREILLSDENYPFLSASAQKYLGEMRVGIWGEGVFDELNEKKLSEAYLWVGTRENISLYYLLKSKKINCKADTMSITFPNSKLSVADIINVVNNSELTDMDMSNVEIEGVHLKYVAGKFSDKIPKSLLEKQFRLDFIDMQSLRSTIKRVR